MNSNNCNLGFDFSNLHSCFFNDIICSACVGSIHICGDFLDSEVTTADLEGPKWCYLGAFWVEPFIFWWWPGSCFTDEHCRVTFSEVLLRVWESHNLWMFWRSRNISQSCNNLVIKTFLMLYFFFLSWPDNCIAKRRLSVVGPKYPKTFPVRRGETGK